MCKPKNKLYDNCEIHHPDGTFMCYCSKKLIDWYSKRNLAIKLSDKSIKLNFIPKGKGVSDDTKVGYYIKPKLNCCVVCGTKENLSRHHVVPYRFRKHFSDIYKSHNSFDVLALCLKHHADYETESTKFSNILLKEHNITSSEKDKCKELLGKLKVLLYGHNIPIDRLNILMEEVQKEISSLENLDSVYNDLLESKKLLKVDIYKLLIDKYEVTNFMVMWRKHFIETMNPEFLPIEWVNSLEETSVITSS